MINFLSRDEELMHRQAPDHRFFVELGFAETKIILAQTYN